MSVGNVHAIEIVMIVRNVSWECTCNRESKGS